MKKRISFFVVLVLLLTMIPQFAFAATAKSDTVAAQLHQVFIQLTADERADLSQAKSNIIGLKTTNPTLWDTIFDQISTNPSLYPVSNQTEIKDFIADAASICFSASSTDLAGDLLNLKQEHLDTFKAIFGNSQGEPVLNDLVNLIMDIIANPETTITNYINNSDIVILLGTDTNQEFIDKMESIATEAAVGIITESSYDNLETQLNNVHWSIAGMVDAVYTLIQAADTANLDASNALVNAAIRSKADLTGSTSLTVGNTATYTIGLFGQETNAVKFALSDSTKGTFTGNVLTAAAAGTPDLRVYRAGVDPVAEPLNYIYSTPITITAVSNNNDHTPPSGGGGATDTPSDTTDTKEVPLGSGNVTANVTQVNGQNVATVTVNTQAITNLIQQNGAGITIAIPVTATADVVKAELPGTLIQTMQASQVIVKVETAAASYAIPSNDIVEAIKAEFGTDTALANVSVNIQIAEPPAAQVKIVQDTAAKNNLQVVVPPVEFDVSCTYNGKTVDVNKFNSYVERTIPIPDGVDPSKITTGIVLNSDGTFSHVPTSIVNISGKYYAKINSLTNSVYSVIYSNKAFADVSNHWAKADVNDMASRLIINGINDTTFEPDKDITRAEFMAIVVRGLGLLRTGQGNASFADVKSSDWYYDAVSIAKEYGITNGKNGNFDPNSKITREEAMTMIARAMKITGIDTNISTKDINTQLSAFTDNAKVSDWAKASAAVCVKNNVIGGYNKMISAQNKITRAETATIVKRMLAKAKLINQ